MAETDGRPPLAGGLPEEAARRLVGPRADYYVARWAGIEEPGPAVGFNWAAFFFGPLWTLYRRMYRTFAWVMGALVLLVALESFAAYLLGITELPRIIQRAANVGFGVVMGIYGSYWYLLEVRRRYDRVRAGDGFTEADLDRAGGVSWGAAAIGAVVVAAIIVASVTMQALVE